MVRVIVSPDVLRGKSDGRWLRRGLMFVTGASVASAVAGLALGYLGGLVPLSARVVLALALAAAGVALGAWEVSGRRPRLLQWNRETPRRWLHLHHMQGAVATGAWLGLGVTTRVGFSVVYVAPLAAFVFGTPWLGAALYGAYGCARGVAAVVVSSRAVGVGGRRQQGSGMERVGSWLFAQSGLARVASGTAVLLIAGAVLGAT